MPRISTETVTLRIRCCRCGHVERFVAASSEAFAFADRWMRAPCPGDGVLPCGSRDRRLDARSVPASGAHGRRVPGGDAPAASAAAAGDVG